MDKHVVVVGSINFDYFFSVSALPQKGQTIYIKSIENACGGKGANQAVQCAKLGLPTTMIGAVGSDPEAEELIRSMNDAGVDVSYVRKVAGPSGRGYVTSAQDGSLHSLILRGANWEVAVNEVEQYLPVIDHNTILVLQMEIPIPVVEFMIEKGYRCNATVILNCAPAQNIHNELFAFCDYAVFNETEAAYYLGESISVSIPKCMKQIGMLSQKIGCPCIITLGSAGAIYRGKERSVFCPAEQVDVVETTGAGDSFIGGLVYGIVHDWNIEETMRFATKCSAFTIQGVGAQESMPYLGQLV